MPTINIIGYLWSKRQELELDGLPDVLEMVADLQRTGLECVQVADIVILGMYVEPSVHLVLRTPEDWASLVEDAIITASAEHTIGMLHQHEESDGA